MSRTLLALSLGLLAFVPAAARAHEVRPASLEIRETAPGRYDVLWRTPVLAGTRLPLVLTFPDDVRDLREPVVQEFADSILERRVIEATHGGLTGKRIEFRGLQATITDVLVRVRLADGRTLTTLVYPSEPWVEIAAERGPLAVAAVYALHGIEHISFGFDHLLFVLGLLLVVESWGVLLETVTAFTIGHSITLAVATLGYADAPVAPVNTAIALSILFLGPEIVRSWRGETSFTIRHPWAVALLFGLLHGLGFAGALTSAGLPAAELPLALFSFNVGVECGQVGFVLLVVLLGRGLRRLDVRRYRWAEMLPAYAVGSLGAFWTIQSAAVMLGALR